MLTTAHPPQVEALKTERSLHKRALAEATRQRHACERLAVDMDEQRRELASLQHRTAEAATRQQQASTDAMTAEEAAEAAASELAGMQEQLRASQAAVIASDREAAEKQTLLHNLRATLSRNQREAVSVADLSSRVQTLQDQLAAMQQALAGRDAELEALLRRLAEAYTLIDTLELRTAQQSARLRPLEEAAAGVAGAEAALAAQRVAGRDLEARMLEARRELEAVERMTEQQTAERARGRQLISQYRGCAAQVPSTCSMLHCCRRTTPPPFPPFRLVQP